MVFSYTIINRGSCGRYKRVVGTYTNTATTTGGAIYPGLKKVVCFEANCEVTEAGTQNLVARAVASAGTNSGLRTGVTLTTVASEDGTWEAIGY